MEYHKVDALGHRKTTFKGSQVKWDCDAQRKRRQRQNNVELKAKKADYLAAYRAIPEYKAYQKDYQAAYQAIFKEQNMEIVVEFIQDYIREHNLTHGAHVQFIQREERQNIVDKMFTDKTLINETSDPYLRVKSIEDMVSDCNFYIYFGETKAE